MTSALGYRFPGDCFKAAVLAMLVCGEIARGAEPNDPIPMVEPSQLPAELQAVQRSLGGSSLSQFPSLRGETGAVRTQGRLRAALEQRPAHHGLHRNAIGALRDAAMQLDMSANRLESLELYTQADAMRQLAQQMRVDARGLTAGGDPSIAPTPTLGEPLRVRPEPQWENSMPQLQTSPRPDVRIAPEIEPAPAEGVVPPPLEPTPEPTNRDDRPKPQPLLDSPQASPKPDVEIEG